MDNGGGTIIATYSGFGSWTSNDYIAYELKWPLQRNPQKEECVQDPEAGKMLHREYREGYSVPV